MSKGKRYTEQLKQEAVKQVVERGYSVAEVAEHLILLILNNRLKESSVSRLFLGFIHADRLYSVRVKSR